MKFALWLVGLIFGCAALVALVPGPSHATAGAAMRSQQRACIEELRRKMNSQGGPLLDGHAVGYRVGEIVGSISNCDASVGLDAISLDDFKRWVVDPAKGGP